MRLRAALLSLALVPALASCAATMTAAEFDRRFPSPGVPLTEPMPPEDTDDTAAARAAAAQRCVEIVGPESFFTLTVHEEADALPNSTREARVRAIHSALSADVMQAPMIDLMTRHFTRTQILALTQFAETPEGLSTLQKSGHQSGPILPSEGPDDTLDDRRVATERFFAKADFRRLYGDLVRGSVRKFDGDLVRRAARNLPSDTDRARMYAIANDRYEQTRREQFDQLSQYFTCREIDAMARFYGSPIGQGVFVRMPLFQLDLAWLIVERIGHAGSIVP